MLQVQFQKQLNKILNEKIVVPRLVNTQSVDFADWCARLSNGSTVMAADVAAVMQQLETKVIDILTLNAKCVCSPSGIILRPKVSGSLSQSQLKARLEARKAAETDPQKAARIDVNREIETSDLSISDCTLSIEVTLPKGLNAIFEQRADMKRVTKASEVVTEGSTEDTDDTENSGGGGNSGGGSTQGGGSDNTGGNTGGGDNTGGNTGGGGDNGGGDGDDQVDQD